jgi:hypothetical protein
MPAPVAMKASVQPGSMARNGSHAVFHCPIALSIGFGTHEWYNISEAARLLKTSRAKLEYRPRKLGRIPFTREA